MRLEKNARMQISIHAPRTGSDAAKEALVRAATISIHAPRTGSDNPPGKDPRGHLDFNPRSPHGERHWQRRSRAGSAHFNPRSPHGERLISGEHNRIILSISIHAPRTGSDDRQPVLRLDGRHFNPRSPHGERPFAASAGQKSANFNPRSPHGERLVRDGLRGSVGAISIHAPRTGSDLPLLRQARRARRFQSTLPARGATDEHLDSNQQRQISIHAPRTGSDWYLRRVRNAAGISIHAPRTGSDAFRSIHSLDVMNFNPRSPHGERHSAVTLLSRCCPFQSTLPARGATVISYTPSVPAIISIHAPRTGSDGQLATEVGNVEAISIHAPRTGSDHKIPSYQ